MTFAQWMEIVACASTAMVPLDELLLASLRIKTRQVDPEHRAPRALLPVAKVVRR